jgi:hypothetical protein
VIIDRDLEGATAGRDEGERFDVLLEPQEFFRQTDGLRLIVSNGAVFDADVQCHTEVALPGRRLGMASGSVKQRNTAQHSVTIRTELQE